MSETSNRQDRQGAGAGSSASSALKIRMFGRTDVGQVREHNEDNFLVANLGTNVRGLREENRNPEVIGDGMLLGVCDGMGGAAAGEVASQLAVDLIYDQFIDGGPIPDRDTLARRLVHSIEYAGARIFQEARADRTRRGMGTTATIAAFRDSRIFLGQVGDSRAYLLRDGKLAQLTRDQSLVNQLIEAGQLTEEEAETFEHNNIILQALGTSETVQVDLTYADLCKGDVVMMCSDGLSGMIRADEIHEILERVTDPLDACRELTDRANAAGGHDNITVLVVRFDEGLDGPKQGSEFGYQKYALPEASAEQLGTPRPDRGNYDTHPEGISDEALREERQLRVSHTMIGVASPLAGREEELSSAVDQHEETPESGTPSPRAQRDHGATDKVSSNDSPTPDGTRRSDSATHTDNAGETPSSADVRYGGDRPRATDPPVELPTSGLPPALMSTIVVSAVLLAALLGYLALR